MNGAPLLIHPQSGGGKSRQGGVAAIIAGNDAMQDGQAMRPMGEQRAAKEE